VEAGEEIIKVVDGSERPTVADIDTALYLRRQVACIPRTRPARTGP
jgi:hypothetical protein